MTDPPVDNLLDLTAVVRTAAGGRAVDTEPLCQRLQRGRLLLALRHPFSGPDLVNSVFSEPGTIEPHQLELTESFVGTLFTNENTLEAASDRYSWRTGDGAVRHIVLPGDLALHLLVQKREIDGLTGIHINPGDHGELQLNWDATSALMNGEPFSAGGPCTQTADATGSGVGGMFTQAFTQVSKSVSQWVGGLDDVHPEAGESGHPASTEPAETMADVVLPTVEWPGGPDSLEAKVYTEVLTRLQEEVGALALQCTTDMAFVEQDALLVTVYAPTAFDESVQAKVDQAVTGEFEPVLRVRFRVGDPPPYMAHPPEDFESQLDLSALDAIDGLDSSAEIDPPAPPAADGSSTPAQPAEASNTPPPRPFGHIALEPEDDPPFS